MSITSRLPGTSQLSYARHKTVDVRGMVAGSGDSSTVFRCFDLTVTGDSGRSPAAVYSGCRRGCTRRADRLGERKESAVEEIAEQVVWQA